MQARFKAGQTVRVKYLPNYHFFIIESLKQTCYAGVEQVFYTGRGFFKELIDVFGSKKPGATIRMEYEKFSDIELEEIPVREMSEREKELRGQYQKAKKEKEDFIETQDFENAAAARDRQRRFADLVKLFEDDLV